jgi:hypothetical protein
LFPSQMSRKTSPLSPRTSLSMQQMPHQLRSSTVALTRLSVRTPPKTVRVACVMERPLSAISTSKRASARSTARNARRRAACAAQRENVLHAASPEISVAPARTARSAAWHGTLGARAVDGAATQRHTKGGRHSSTMEACRSDAVARPIAQAHRSRPRFPRLCQPFLRRTLPPSYRPVIQPCSRLLRAPLSLARRQNSQPSR